MPCISFMHGCMVKILIFTRIMLQVIKKKALAKNLIAGVRNVYTRCPKSNYTHP